MVYLGRAVDHESEVLESYVTRTRDKAAALRGAGHVNPSAQSFLGRS